MIEILIVYLIPFLLLIFNCNSCSTHVCHKIPFPSTPYMSASEKLKAMNNLYPNNVRKTPI